MALSVISSVTFEGQPQGLSSFLRAGVMYVFWYAPIDDMGHSRLHWKPHTAADFTEITPALSASFQNVTALYHTASDQLLVVWDDGRSQLGLLDGVVYSARFNVLTGALVSGPTLLFPGAKPQLSYCGAIGSNFLLYYLMSKVAGIYGKLSTDGGVTWYSGEPILTNQVLASTQVKVLPYDANHVAIAQLGTDPRGLAEISVLTRTRPLVAIVKHPTVANQFFVAEPSKYDDTTLTDNLRGGLVLSTDNTSLYQLGGVVQGTSDGVGAVALITVTGTAPAVTASAVTAGNGDDLQSYTLTPALGSLAVDMPGASCAVALAISSTHGYVAEYTDNSAVLGQLIVVDLSSGATGTVVTGLAGVRAVGVANFATPTPLIFVATTESSVERLRVYQQNALTPALLLNTKLPARVNSLTVIPSPVYPNGARILASMVDRFSVYDYNTASTPVVLLDSYHFSGAGQFFKAAVATNSNIVLASRESGVLVLSPTGRVIAQLTVSGKTVNPWVPATSYSLGDFRKPRSRHPFTRHRMYFRCTTAGTSGASEPAWTTTGTVVDAGAQWTAQGVLDGLVTDIALDETAKRIYAVGSAGGVLGTDGRLWVLSANGLI